MGCSPVIDAPPSLHAPPPALPRPTPPHGLIGQFRTCHTKWLPHRLRRRRVTSSRSTKRALRPRMPSSPSCVQSATPSRLRSSLPTGWRRCCKTSWRRPSVCRTTSRRSSLPQRPPTGRRSTTSQRLCTPSPSPRWTSRPHSASARPLKLSTRRCRTSWRQRTGTSSPSRRRSASPSAPSTGRPTPRPSRSVLRTRRRS